ncbi:MAG TPA: glucose-6-phosphate isomerase [Xanthomonadales bacterium]|nr:glucose-6-phosphate isomerase [Xanthomonadales bacterium]
MAEIYSLLHKYNKNRPAIGELLDNEPDRYGHFSGSACGLLLDFSRCGLDSESISNLFELANLADFESWREKLFSGAAINFTENRSVLHPLWRHGNFRSLLPDDESARLGQAVKDMGTIATALRSGHLPGDETARVRHIVHIGIGGSLLGPKLLVDACSQPGDHDRDVPEIHFLSSVDPGPREQLLSRLDPSETAIIIVSKSFTTSEVMTHARSLFAWQEAALDAKDVARRRFAVTSMPDKAAEWSIAKERVLEMGEWTGGRYSLWSPVGLTAAIAMGPEAFNRLLEGGAAMDAHFQDAPMEQNLPVIAALIDVWHRNICDLPNLAVIPYESRLAELPGWLQQVAMESNGKGTSVNGEPVNSETSQVIFGDCGTDAQHSFFQAFHQGTEVVPVDFIGVINSGHSDNEANARLVSHMLAQATALARGKDLAAVRADMKAAGVSLDEINRLAQHRVMPGNRPSNIILMDEFSPETLGALLVFYEHRVFVQSVIWGINAFDQWGVELGKTLAGAIEPSVVDPSIGAPDGLHELNGLLDHIQKYRR